MVSKPASKAGMMPPFERIGERCWADKLRSFLTSYGVPLPDCATESELKDCERRIGTSLPPPIRQFLEMFGAVSFDYVTVFAPIDIRIPDEWFSETLPDETKSQLKEFIRVADAGGTGNVFVLHIPTGVIHFLSHDLLSNQRCLASFDDLIRIACISIHAGYYGWPDDDIQEMV